MKVLAVDTCGQALSLCVSNGKKSWSRNLAGGARRDDVLFAECEKLLKKAGLVMKDLDGLIAATGPGSFTGIRVGLTFTSILAQSLGRPAAGVSRFEAAAERASKADPVGTLAVLISGTRDELFFQAFRKKDGFPEASGSPVVVIPADWPALWKKSGCEGLAGPGAAAAAKLIGKEKLIINTDEPSAEDAVAAGARKIEKGVEELAPLYIKPAYYERGLAVKK